MPKADSSYAEGFPPVIHIPPIMPVDMQIIIPDISNSYPPATLREAIKTAAKAAVPKNIPASIPKGIGQSGETASALKSAVKRP